VIVLSDVSRTVTSGTTPPTILHSASFQIGRGRTVAVTGPSGRQIAVYHHGSA
jgi:ABC-type lipoprotein export system ATPase subunit